MEPSGEAQPMHDIAPLFQGVCAEVTRGIGRPRLMPQEMAAVGFVLEREMTTRPEEDYATDSAQFARELFGVGQADSKEAIAWKVHNKINDVLVREIARRREAGENSQFLTEMEEQVAFMHDQAADAYTKGEVCILGTVPDIWLSSRLQQRVRAEMFRIEL